MIALSNQHQYLGFEVFDSGPAGDKLEFTIHSEGAAIRLLGRSGGATSTVTRSQGLNGLSGRLDFSAVTDVLRGTSAVDAGSLTIKTITLYNPGSVAVEASVTYREDDVDTDPEVPAIVRHGLWRFMLQPKETFTYTYGAGVSISPAPESVGLLSGVANNVPLLITATTPGTAQTVHTSVGLERVSLRAGCTNAAAVTLGVLVGGVEWQSSVSQRTSIILLEGEPLGAAQTIQVYASITGVATVWGSWEGVDLA